MGNGNSKGFTPSFSLWHIVTTPKFCKDEVTLPFDKSNWIDFYLEIEIPFNLWIKVWTPKSFVGTSVEVWPIDFGSVLGDLVSISTTLDLGLRDLECDLEFVGDFEGDWLLEWPFDLGLDLVSINSLKALLLAQKMLMARNVCLNIR